MNNILKYTIAIILVITCGIITIWSLYEAYINITSPISLALVILGTISLITLLVLVFLLVFEWCTDDINDPVEVKSSEDLDEWDNKWFNE